MVKESGKKQDSISKSILPVLEIKVKNIKKHFHVEKWEGTTGKGERAVAGPRPPPDKTIE